MHVNPSIWYLGLLASFRLYPVTFNSQIMQNLTLARHCNILYNAGLEVMKIFSNLKLKSEASDWLSRV